MLREATGRQRFHLLLRSTLQLSTTFLWVKLTKSSWLLDHFGSEACHQHYGPLEWKLLELDQHVNRICNFSAQKTLTSLGAHLYGAYALPNGMSVVKWEASNNETSAIVLCSTCIDHQECTSRSSKSTLMATPTLGCSTSVSFHGEKEVSGIFTTTSVILKFYAMHFLVEHAHWRFVFRFL